MRLYTHTDLDGVMCAVLLSCVEEIDEYIFIDPATIQAKKIRFTDKDIIADLPYDKRAGLWFDHHLSSRPKEGRAFKGCWKMAPSATRVIYDYYDNPYLEKYKEAVEATDKIDSGNISLEEAISPKGWFLLSNTIELSANKEEDDDYRRYLINLIRKKPAISEILADKYVSERAEKVKIELEKFIQILKNNTVMIGKVAYSDLRKISDLPRGNNYIIYSLFPESVSSVRLMPEREDKDSVKISVGHNVYHLPKSTFDISLAMKKIGGGGHQSAGGARIKKEDAELIAKQIIKEINDWEEEKGKK